MVQLSSRIAALREVHDLFEDPLEADDLQWLDNESGLALDIEAVSHFSEPSTKIAERDLQEHTAPPSVSETVSDTSSPRSTATMGVMIQYADNPADSGTFPPGHVPYGSGIWLQSATENRPSPFDLARAAHAPLGRSRPRTPRHVHRRSLSSTPPRLDRHNRRN